MGLQQPLGGCARGEMLLLVPLAASQDTPLNKIISAPLLLCVTAGWAQDVTPLGLTVGLGIPSPAQGEASAIRKVSSDFK